jgi:outer membrane receptor protein involved in Fe transport
MFRSRTLFRSFLTMCLMLALTGAALGQTTTASIRGNVTDEGGNPFPTAEISARNNATGFTYRAVAGNDGGFLLAGLTPGTYRIDVIAPSYRATSRDLTVGVGQTLDLNFKLQPDLVVMEQITVVGSTPIEMQATEIATNVTRQQIENLPQGNRNFMNFATLAPGLRISDDEFRKTFAAGAQTANAVNVFIDGVSFKNDVLQGGVVGQDSSRGNPFPQNAVQEFRVLTQNYSAEFQKASSAVITAVTKSGTNELTGDLFGFYQDKSLIDSRNPLATNPGEKPAYERLQLGASIGGPVIRDRMHFFLSYESNEEDRESTVTFGGTTSTAADRIRQQYASAPGLYGSPFELRLLFGKLSFQPSAANLFDLSGYVREESDVRGFSGQTSFESAEDVAQDIWQIGLRHQLTGGSWLNEASVSFQEYTWNPQPVNGTTIGLDFQGVIRVGGRDSEQNFTQERLSLRDDITFSGFGKHAIKVGGNIDLLDYTVFKDFAGNPVFRFRNTEGYEFPFEASYGLGNPDLSGDNTQVGLYVQDDWHVTDRATVNAGVRWDYESDMFPTDYVTPDRVRTGVAFLNLPSNYFSDGDDREAIDDMFAPRLGATYDLFGNNKSIVFGGWGRYYDRILYNNSLDERFRLQFSVGLFRFSRDGAPRDGQPTVAWNPRFLSEAGLQEVLATGVTGNPEVFLIENDTNAPYSDQWNIGLRQQVGQFVGELSYGNVRSKNGFTFIRGNRRADGTCCLAVPGFAGVIISSDDVKTWYDAIYFKLDRPFTAGSNWSAGLAYTYSDATQIGGDLFSLDFPRVEDYPRYPTQAVPDHSATLNLLYRLPWDITFGSLFRYTSGLKYNIDDQSRGGGVNERRFLRGEGEEDDDALLDFRLEKTFRFGGVGLGLIGEVFNVFDDKLFNNYDGFIPTLPATNANFGKPRGVAFGSGRRFQYGVRVTF